MTPIRKISTTELKVKVVREILREETSLSQIASEYGTHTNVISRISDERLYRKKRSNGNHGRERLHVDHRYRFIGIEETS